MKYILLAPLLLFSISLFCQENTDLNTSNKKLHSAISFNLVTPLDPLNPRYGIGYLQKLTDNWAVELDIAYGTDAITISGKDDNREEKYELWELRPEVYYSFSHSKNTITYLAVEYFYIKTTDVFTDDYYTPENTDTDVTFDRADFNRIKQGLHLKMGHFITLFKNFDLNLYYGIGFRNRDIKYTNVINPEVQESDSGLAGGIFETLFSGAKKLDFKVEEGTKSGVNLTAGIKLNYLF